MKNYQFALIMTIDASSKEEAKERAQSALQNLSEMAGYSPYGCELELIKNSCAELEFDEEDEYES